jgi:hypothetical protein
MLTKDPDAHISVTFTNHVNTDKAINFLTRKNRVRFF